jgi:hypothetical protein
MKDDPVRKPPDNNVGAMIERHLGCLPVIAVVAITIISSHFTFRLAEYLYIKGTFGQAAWDGGLRVVDNKGHLSNGQELSGAGNFLVNFGSYLMSVPFFAGSAFGFVYLSMRLRGERFSEQLRRWKSEHEEPRS